MTSRGVYVIAIENVDHAQVQDPKNVVSKCKEILDRAPDSGFELSEISTLSELDNLIDEAPEDIIVVNGHGETLPTPSNRIGAWRLYLGEIRNNISEKGWTYVSVAGVPFYYVASGPERLEIRLDGVNGILKDLEGSIIGWIPTYLSITELGRKLSAIYEAFDIPETILCSRTFLLKDLLPSRSVFSSGYAHGVCSFGCGKGFLVISGLMPEGLGWVVSEKGAIPGQASKYCDALMTEIPLILALHIRKSFHRSQDIFEASKSDEDRFREEVVIPMLRLNGFRHVVDFHRTGKYSEQGKDVTCFSRDAFGREVFHGLQVKVGDVGTSDVRGICGQVWRGFITQYDDTYFNRKVDTHYMYVVTSGDFTGPARNAIVDGVTKGSLGAQFERYLRFLNGEDVLELLKKMDL